MGSDVVLLDVPTKEWKVENKRDPIAIDQEEECQETMHSSLRDDVGVETVAEVDGVDVIAIGLRSAYVISRGEAPDGKAFASSRAARAQGYC